LELAVVKGRSLSQTTIAIIGAGQMAEALIGGWIGAKIVDPSAVWATDVSQDRLASLRERFGIRVGSSNSDAVTWADVVLLAVKPQVMEAVLKEVGGLLAGRLVISIAAGIRIDWIRERSSPRTQVIRVMPNTPALVKAGMSALAIGHGVTDSEVALGTRLFEAVGKTVQVEERMMDAVTGLSGSGPAYVFLAIEALADGGVNMGLPRATAQLLAAQTVLGAAKMVVETGEHPARLKDQVTSPGGTTIAGLQQLERGRLRATFMAAVEAATLRSKELGG
jgi:pyrroline-5-carboxylate reductase